ncbi:MAG: L-serine ammonia-lyase, iron-sulfur-dependent, subunit alpha [Synergistales bacterium]|nr:L-serine ammonia-lyase, iron-sulfur-dependent, subunit alpha [Synergistales bacterium]
MRSLDELTTLCKEWQCSLPKTILHTKEQESGQSPEHQREAMASRLADMRRSVEEALSTDREPQLVENRAPLLGEYRPAEGPLSGGVILEAGRIALAVAASNACMGRIVAAPTAGSCGILPGILFSYDHHFKPGEAALVDALITAAGIGNVIAERATLAGASGGCQAECGAAAAMGAGALVQLRGGNADQISQAAALTLKSLLGLVCDPVGGLVEVPCIVRNGTLVALSAIGADMALAGVRSAIPADEVIDTMGAVGRALPETLRETARGGLAVSPTGRSFTERLREQSP